MGKPTEEKQLGRLKSAVDTSLQLLHGPFLCTRRWEAGGGCGRCSAGSPRNATSLLAMLGKQWQEGGLERRGRGGRRESKVIGEDIAGMRDREMRVTCFYKPGATEQAPGCSDSYPREPERIHLKFEGKRAAEGGSSHSLWDYIPEQPPRSPSQATLSGATGRRCPQPSAHTLVESSGGAPTWTNLE